MRNTGIMTTKKNSTGARMCVSAMLSVTPNFIAPMSVNTSAITRTDFVKPNDILVN